MAEKRPITVEDLNLLHYIESPAFSPDGKWIVYVKVTPDPMKKGYKRNLWLCSADGGKPRQITHTDKDRSPSWSPDGTLLAFVSGRGKKPQVYLLPVDIPGEARQLTDMPNGVSHPEWSPDGKTIAFLSAMNADERAHEDSDEADEPPQDELEAAYRADRKQQDDDAFYDPLRAWKIPYREGTTYRDGRWRQVYITSVSEDAESKPYRLTNLDANYGALAWSPDGQSIYSFRSSDPKGDESWGNRLIVKLNVADATEETLSDEKHGIFQPKPSPDGKWIACVRMFEGKTDILPRFSLIPTAGGTPIDLNKTLDRSVSDFQWTHNNQLMGLVASEGEVHVYQFNPTDQSYQPLTSGNMQITAFDFTENGDLVYAASTPENPAELYVQLKGEAMQPYTAVNQPLLDEVMVQPMHEVRFKSPSGDTIQGWYILPVGYEDGKQYPLALNIHGGPHAMWSAGDRAMWHEWQSHAAAGYVVFACNPRGSDGYGEKHMHDLHANWGGVAMEDIMAGVETVIEKGFVDAERMAITGGSYGGYLTAWIISHSERFKAAVAQRGVYNLVSFYGTTDIPYFMETEYDGQPWRDHERLWQESPVAHAHKIKTPLLIIHSENDFRVPIEQGEQLFALVRRATDTPVEMLRYPREGHELSRSGEPNHRISRLTEMIRWFDAYCKG